jgi:hypothetical protein
MGGHLATLTTKEENDWAMKEFLQSGTRVWLGAHREGSAWRWVTGEPWEFTSWVKDEPSNKGGLENRLEMIDKVWALGRGWNDVGGALREGVEEKSDGYLVEWDSVQPAEAPMVASAPLAAPASEASTPPAPQPGTKVSPAVQKWLEQMSATFQARYQREAVAPYEAALKALRDQYVAAVQRGVAAATTGARLEEAIAWRAEVARLEAGEQPHSTRKSLMLRSPSKSCAQIGTGSSRSWSASASTAPVPFTKPSMSC